MKYLDSFNHFFPKRFWDAVFQSGGATRDIGKRMHGVPCIYDLNERLRLVDSFESYTQVISLGIPSLEALGTPEQVEEFDKLDNAGMADLVLRYAVCFVGFLASLPTNWPNAAKEAERAFSLGANDLQIHSNINDFPLDDERFFPVLETGAKHGSNLPSSAARSSWPVRLQDREELVVLDLVDGWLAARNQRGNGAASHGQIA